MDTLKLAFQAASFVVAFICFLALALVLLGVFLGIAQRIERRRMTPIQRIIHDQIQRNRRGRP